MHTKISPNNPYKYNRSAFAWEHVPEGDDGHLDFGCNNGKFLNQLRPKKTGQLVGVDVSEEAVNKGHKLFPELEIIKINESGNLPFDNGTFYSVTVLDVLEHVYKQADILTELNRILIDGGKLIVTVPGQHLFSFLDMGNFKFRFPGLHRWYYCLTHSQDEYERRYASNPDGLIGDISARKRWHEHFSREKLNKLLTTGGFKVIDIDGTGYFCRVIRNVNHFFQWLKPVQKFLNWLLSLDYRLFESANLFCIAEKRRNKYID